MQRMLGAAICLEYQLQNASAMLWDDDRVGDRLGAVLHVVHRQAVDHIADLDPEVRAQLLDRSEIAHQIAEAERIFGPTTQTQPSVHIRALCGLMLEATLTYESLLMSAVAVGRSDLAALARRNLARCARALGALDAGWPELLREELSQAGTLLSDDQHARCLERITNVWRPAESATEERQLPVGRRRRARKPDSARIPSAP